MSRVKHFCGCVTEFDTALWKSVPVKRCSTHARVASKYGEA